MVTPNLHLLPPNTAFFHTNLSKTPQHKNEYKDEALEMFTIEFDHLCYQLSCCLVSSIDALHTHLGIMIPPWIPKVSSTYSG